MWRWARWADVIEDVKMSRCEDEKMFRRCEDEQMFYRPPLLEEPCAQTLSGKNIFVCCFSPFNLHIYSGCSIRFTPRGNMWNSILAKLPRCSRSARRRTPAAPGEASDSRESCAPPPWPRRLTSASSGNLPWSWPRTSWAEGERYSYAFGKIVTI